jgi:hypothetical protein
VFQLITAVFIIDRFSAAAVDDFPTKANGNDKAEDVYMPVNKVHYSPEKLFHHVKLLHGLVNRKIIRCFICWLSSHVKSPLVSSRCCQLSNNHQINSLIKQTELDF